ncbi:MAG: IS66 family insertion sequence element accessory protein TnpB [Tannerellaceae bacterium]|nr:IS66 family insertion sequence element accessory protein TnpB [Tannerellaceae bacterium]
MRYRLCPSSQDMRKGFDVLSGVVRSDMGRDPLTGEVFIFMNRSRTTIKLLHWERGGLVLYHKRLEKGRFSLPVFYGKSRCYHLLWRDLVLMVEGLSPEKVRRKKDSKISHKTHKYLLFYLVNCLFFRTFVSWKQYKN